MRRYVAMCYDECSDERRATQEEYEYKDFDEESALELRLFQAWKDELEMYLNERQPSEWSTVWLERVDKVAYTFNGFGEMF